MRTGLLETRLNIRYLSPTAHNESGELVEALQC